MRKNFKQDSKHAGSKKGKSKVNRKKEFEENKDKEAFGNDIAWYVNNPQMLIDAANISYANVLSKPILFNEQTLSGETYYNELECPGVMSIRLVPTIGSVLRDEGQYQTGDMWDSSVNMAARAEWSFIRQKNAGAKNYDAPDLMMYHLAMDNIYMYWSWMVRVYGYMRLYAFKNKFYPLGILRAMGLTDSAINDLRAKMADFRTYINLFAAQMSSFAVPINLPYVKRHLWLFQNAFTDASTTKAQVYVYNPEFLYALEEVSEEPMSLVYCPMPWQSATSGALQNANLNAIKVTGDNLLSRIVKSESCNIMSGDILKAYEAGGIYGFQSIPDDFSLTPVYDETVLSQIHNLTVTPVNTGLIAGDSYIAQDPAIDAGYIYQVLPCGAAGVKSVVLDSRFETPTPTDAMYATRLTAVSEPSNENYISCGSEIVVGLTFWLNASDDSKLNYGSSQIDNDIYTVNFRGRTGEDYEGNPIVYLPFSDVQKYQRFMSIISKFDWHPLIITRSREQDSGGVPVDMLASVYGDVDNFAIVENQTIAKMHKVALNSEFGLPYTLTSIK